MLRSLQPHKLVCSGELNGVAWQVLMSGGSYDCKALILKKEHCTIDTLAIAHLTAPTS